MSTTTVSKAEPLVEVVVPAPKEHVQPKAKQPLTMPSFKNFFARVKKVKHIEVYAAVVVISVMVLIFFSSLGGGGKPKSGNTNLTNMEVNYVREMEEKLVSVLSQVKGAGRVNAMVTAVGSATLEIAYNIDEKSVTQNGSGETSTTTTTVTKTPVMVGGQPFVLMEIKPKLKGVIIVATGAYDPAVRLNLLRAVQALVADPTVNIEVLARY